MNSISRQEAIHLLSKKKGKNKFGAKKTVIDGETFDSKAESNRWAELRRMEKAGLISNLERQPRFNLKCGDRPILLDSGRQAFYKADFAYWNGSERVIEDVKGVATPEYKLKRAIVHAMFPAVRITEIRKSKRGKSA